MPNKYVEWYIKSLNVKIGFINKQSMAQAQAMHSFITKDTTPEQFVNLVRSKSIICTDPMFQIKQGETNV